MEKVKAATDGTWSSLTGELPPVPSPPSASTWSVPAAPMPAPPMPRPTHSTSATQSVSDAADEPIDPTAILDELVDTVDGVRSAILASVDGFGLARSRSMDDEASHPAMLAAAVGLAHQLVSMSGGERLRQLVVDHDGGLLLVWPIGEQRVLAVLASSTLEQRNARSFVRSRHSALSGVSS